MSRSRHDLPGALGEHLSRELERLGGGPAGAGRDLVELARTWPDAVGQTIARNAWPARVGRDGSIVVHTSSSVWAHELTQMEPAVRERLGDTAPRKLTFIVGPLPEHGAQEEPGRAGAEPVEVADCDRAVAAELTATIEGRELRERVQRVVELSLAAARPAPPDRRV